ncbi:MAG: hypothetical protein RQ741_02365 [Wenzhouxiangellaceae bacterium]|nr:hypothetical protein [Wenzhouxiangellaceae bacterium]
MVDRKPQLAISGSTDSHITCGNARLKSRSKLLTALTAPIIVARALRLKLERDYYALARLHRQHVEYSEHLRTLRDERPHALISLDRHKPEARINMTSGPFFYGQPPIWRFKMISAALRHQGR